MNYRTKNNALKVVLANDKNTLMFGIVILAILVYLVEYKKTLAWTQVMWAVFIIILFWWINGAKKVQDQSQSIKNILEAYDLLFNKGGYFDLQQKKQIIPAGQIIPSEYFNEYDLEGDGIHYQIGYTFIEAATGRHKHYSVVVKKKDGDVSDNMDEPTIFKGRNPLKYRLRKEWVNSWEKLVDKYKDKLSTN